MIKLKRYRMLARFLKYPGNNESSKAIQKQRLEELLSTLPSGSGLDQGTQLLPESKPNRLVFSSDFHHMNGNGYYDGWSDHKVVVTPCLMFGIDIRITGRNRNDIKDYLFQVWDHWLNEEVEY